VRPTGFWNRVSCGALRAPAPTERALCLAPGLLDMGPPAGRGAYAHRSVLGREIRSGTTRLAPLLDPEPTRCVQPRPVVHTPGGSGRDG
jgi:hypothetical protein